MGIVPNRIADAIRIKFTIRTPQKVSLGYQQEKCPISIQDLPLKKA